jgi:hypothetical protein
MVLLFKTHRKRKRETRWHCLREGLNVVEHGREVGGSETSQRIPSLGGSETVLGAARLSALVGTSGDIVEGSGGSSGHLVQDGVQEAERGLLVVLTVRVQQRDDGTEDGGRARGSVNLLELTLDGDQVGVSEGRNVRETTVLVVEVLGGRESDARGQVGGDGGRLPSGSGDVVRETTTSGDQGVGVRANLLLSGGGALVALASGLVEDLSLTSVGGELSGSDGGNPRRGTREDGGDGSLGGVAVGVGISGSTLITRGSQEGNTSTGDLHELSVDTLDISLRVGALLSVDLALLGLGPSPGPVKKSTQSNK